MEHHIDIPDASQELGRFSLTLGGAERKLDTFMSEAVAEQATNATDPIIMSILSSLARRFQQLESESPHCAFLDAAQDATTLSCVYYACGTCPGDGALVCCYLDADSPPLCTCETCIIPAASNEPQSMLSRIEGQASPCVGEKYEYSYSPGGNYPYHWKWGISRGARILRSWTTATTYECEVEVLDAGPITLTFHQRNPPGVPSVYDVSRHLVGRQCELDGGR